MGSVIGIEWMAAVLSPWAVSPHPNFSEESVLPYQVLALVVDPRHQDVAKFTEKLDDDCPSWARNLIKVARSSLYSETIRDSISDLDEISRDRGVPYGARAVSALFCSVALTELDCLPDAIAILEFLLDDRNGVQDTDEDNYSASIIRGALLLQLAMRRYELQGRSSSVDQTLSMLDHALASKSSPIKRNFELSRSIGWSVSGTLHDTEKILRYGALSLKSRIEGFRGKSWINLAKRREPWGNIKIKQLRSISESAFIDETFDRKTASLTGRSKMFMVDPISEPMSSALLAAELSGNINLIMSLRLSRAKSLLIGDRLDKHSATEGLRLLRMSQSPNNLKAALHLIRAKGPLSAITTDARHVMSRTFRYGNRHSESEVILLGMSADLITDDEVVAASESVWAYIEDVGKTGATAELRSAWMALARLVTNANRDHMVAGRLIGLLRDFESANSNAFIGVEQVVAAIGWNSVASETKSEWRYWASKPSTDSLIAQIQKQITASLDEPLLNSNPETLDHVVTLIDTSDSASCSSTTLRIAEDVVRKAMEDVQQAAATGRFSLGGLDPLEVAAAYVSKFRQTNLWEFLFSILRDPSIDTRYKQRALDRLAKAPSSIPTSIREGFSVEWRTLFRSARKVSLFEEEILPAFPEVLRLGASLRLPYESDILSAVTELSGSLSPTARIEASKTIPAVVKAYAHTDWAIALANQLSRDGDAAVSGEASRTLAQLLATKSSLHSVMVKRLEEVLGSDGVLVPLKAIHGLQYLQAQGELPSMDWLKRTLGVLADSHPSRIVRKAAQRVVSDPATLIEGGND